MCFFCFMFFFRYLPLVSLGVYHWFPQVLAVAVWATVTPSLNFAGAVSRWQAIGSMGKKRC